jgi:hypothetical protein
MDGGFRVDALGGGLCALRIGCRPVAGVCVMGRGLNIDRSFKFQVFSFKKRE